MRGGLERWKRGVGSGGVRQALAYAFEGSCDSHLHSSAGVDALEAYSDAAAGVARFSVTAGEIVEDALNAAQLRRWVDGQDPSTGERRGRDLASPHADLILDGTINAPKSYSIAAMVNADLAAEFEALQDRLRFRIITLWQHELNARRGAGGRVREALHRVEVVELRHRRSRALDPHIHRHLWLSVKVLGEDGKWSNVDSRVAMRFHTVINAEGEIASRTDPEWVAALARNGFTLDGDGEIAELAHAVRPLSRRSTQIEANRAMLLAQWRSDHSGAEPDHDVLTQIDRLAWARSRPNKPAQLVESHWVDMIAHELDAIDPAIRCARAPIATLVVGGDNAVDVSLLAARAIVEADARATGYGGRFSVFDVRGGALRAIAQSGVVGIREALQSLLDAVVAEAMALTTNLLPEAPDRPAHIKGLMSAATAALKADLSARFDALSRPGDRLSDDDVAAAAAATGEVLDDRQCEAVAAIAGTDLLVSVTGPAGSGKTTMLRVARVALHARGRHMVVVAPTKKAASVAAREIGAEASSLHGLLSDHGWRWRRDAAGGEQWTRLRAGDTDPVTGYRYDGPRRYPISPGDRIVVDEAGMVDLRTASALSVVAAEVGAGIAMVGDHLQARPVGHSGAMACMTRRATAVVELTAVHRFTDSDYATLTLRMREPASRDDALAVAAAFSARGLIRRVPDQYAAREAMVGAYFDWAAQHRRVALVTSTNEEADAINFAIQERRILHGELATTRLAISRDEQRLLEGDVVQTRRNDTFAGVDNRAIWTIHRITTDALELAAAGDATDTRWISREYASKHVHLAYASTVHGIQGETTDASIVGPGVDAAGLYVGMTRGRLRNEAITVARTDTAAQIAVAGSMLRGIPEVSIDDSMRAARAELHRAARDPDDTQTAAPRWDDMRARPFGGEPHLDRVAASLTSDLARRAQRVADLDDWLTRAESTVLRATARIASEHAADHHPSAKPAGDESVKIAQLAERLNTRREERDQAHNDLQSATARSELLASERALRERLPSAARVAEDRSRSLMNPAEVGAVRAAAVSRGR